MLLFRYMVLFAIMLSLTTAHTAAANDNSGEMESIRACYEGFKKAFSNKEGEQALTFICAKSLQHYGDMLDVALHGNAKTLEPLTLADKYLVLSIRNRTPYDQVSELTPKTVYILTVAKAWIGTATTANRSIDTVTVISPEKAQVTQQVAGTKTNETITFLKESGAWKIDLAYQDVILNAMLSKSLKKSALSEKDFFEHILSVAANKQVLPRIWEPLMVKSVTPTSQ